MPEREIEAFCATLDSWEEVEFRDRLADLRKRCDANRAQDCAEYLMLVMSGGEFPRKGLLWMS